MSKESSSSGCFAFIGFLAIYAFGLWIVWASDNSIQIGNQRISDDPFQPDTYTIVDKKLAYVRYEDQHGFKYSQHYFLFWLSTSKVKPARK